MLDVRCAEAIAPEFYLGEEAGGCGTSHSRSTLADAFGFAKLFPGVDFLLAQVLKTADLKMEGFCYTLKKQHHHDLLWEGENWWEKEHAWSLKDLLLAPLLLWANRSSQISSSSRNLELMLQRALRS